MDKTSSQVDAKLDTTCSSVDFFLMVSVLGSSGNKIAKQWLHKLSNLRLPMVLHLELYGSLLVLHMRDTLQSGQIRFSFTCSQIQHPPHYLQYDMCLPCSQIPVPLQSMHWHCCLPCSQIPEPPQSLHRWFCIPMFADTGTFAIVAFILLSIVFTDPQPLHLSFRLPWGHVGLMCLCVASISSAIALLF